MSKTLSFLSELFSSKKSAPSHAEVAKTKSEQKQENKSQVQTTDHSFHNPWEKKKISYQHNTNKSNFNLSTIDINSWGIVLAVVFFVISTLLYMQFQLVQKKVQELVKYNNSLLKDMSDTRQTQEDIKLQIQTFNDDLNTIKNYLLLPTSTPAQTVTIPPEATLSP